MLGGIFLSLLVVGLFFTPERIIDRISLTIKGAYRVIPFPISDPRIVIEKSNRVLKLFSGRNLLKIYPIALGFNPTADKEVERDGATPEGEFYIAAKNPQSSLHLSLLLSYPNIEDAKRGLAEGLISKFQHDQIVSAIKKKDVPLQHTKLGGEIYIHGGGAGQDWTLGCIAMNNDGIEELYWAVKIGTPVEVLP